MNENSKIEFEAITPVRKSTYPENKLQICENFHKKTQDPKFAPIKDLDAFYIDNLLSAKECEFLVTQAEELGFTFWHEDRSNKTFRNAETVEIQHKLLSSIIWQRLKPFLEHFTTLSLNISEEETPDRFQRDIKGKWNAKGTNEHILFAKYDEGGYFSPHTDGYDIVSFDKRSMYSIVLFLNETEKGGGTRFYNENQKDNLIVEDGRVKGKKEFIDFEVESKVGRCVVFFHNIMHEGIEIEKGVKYIIRSDIMYEREEKLLKNEKDLEAYNHYSRALELADGTDASEVNDAMLLFRKAFKMSPLLAEIYGISPLQWCSACQLLIEEGFGMDCSSTSELYIADKLGVTPDMVMYTSNFTSKKDLAKAFDQGVILNLDDHTIVDNLVSARGKVPDLISFRLNPGLGRTDSSTKSNVLGGPSAKFGVAPSDVKLAYSKAIKHGAKRFGIHMMTGSCVLENSYWEQTVDILLRTVKNLKADLDIDFEFINIGGGLGIPYTPDQKEVNLEDAVNRIEAKFIEYLGDVKSAWPTLYMENGRYITGPYGWLVSTCEAIKDNEFGLYYGLDANMSNLMRPGMYGAYHHISVEKANGDEKGELKKSNVVGSLCENNDWFAKDRMLPKARIGDFFVIHDTGAHSHSMGFQYNGKLRAPEVLLLDNGEEVLIRNREQIEDLFSNTILP
eukprot:augustus_masked-scaffold_5-processed-gene-11.32-mRNA-1 protein AED:0.13 eAED:0.14 QI:0/0/0/1/1/1/3/0/676